MHSHTVNNLKTFVLEGSYIQLNSDKNMLFSHGLKIPTPTGSLKSSKVGADITMAGRLFQRQTVDGKTDYRISSIIRWSFFLPKQSQRSRSVL